LSTDELVEYKLKYPKWFMGVRFHEVFAYDFTIRANPHWLRPCVELPIGRFWQPFIAQQYLDFVFQNKMWVQWSDWHWYQFAQWDPVQQQTEQQMQELVSKYTPGMITLTYANNEPSANRISNWQTAVSSFGCPFGLSDQGWVCNDTTQCLAVGEWAASAIKQQSQLIQFEPIWTFFNLSLGSFSIGPLTGDGNPTANYKALISVL